MTSDFGADIFDDPTDDPAPSVPAHERRDRPAPRAGADDEPEPARAAGRKPTRTATAEEADGSAATEPAEPGEPAPPDQVAQPHEPDEIAQPDEIEIPRFGTDAGSPDDGPRRSAHSRRRRGSSRSRTDRADPDVEEPEPGDTTDESEPPAVATAEPEVAEPPPTEESPRRRRRRTRTRSRRGDEAEAAGARPAPSDRRRVRAPWPTDVGIGQRVAVFVDVDRITEHARRFGGELAYGNLLRHLAMHRQIVRAVAYGRTETVDARGRTLMGSGFEVQAVDDDGTLAVAIAVDAMAVAPKVDCIVMLSTDASLRPLTDALRGHGIRIETAGFTSTGPGAEQFHHELGEESIFIP